MTVQPIPAAEAKPWIMHKHYARRMPCIMYSYGLFEGVNLVGVCTYGRGASPHLCRGVCGPEYADMVYELSRLCIDSDNRNAASILIAGSLRLMPKPSIIVSFADTSAGHVGYVYQATNWIYTGLSAIRKDAVKEGEEGKHSKGKCGDGYKWVQRPRKHRYIYMLGNKKERAALRANLRYGEEPYPKGDTRSHESTTDIAKQMILIQEATT